jgi:ketosteroid isomerase-like protein
MTSLTPPRTGVAGTVPGAYVAGDMGTVLALLALALPSALVHRGESCPAGYEDRTPERVLEDHRQALLAGDVERDVLCNYAPDAVVISDQGVDSGRDAIRIALQRLVAAFQGAVPTVRSQVVLPLPGRGHMVRVLFSMETSCIDLPDGVDTYLIQAGRILAQTAHASPTFKCASPRP